MKIALAQMAMTADIDENYNKSVKLIKQASNNDCDLICFPEIQLTPFFPQYEYKNVDEYLMNLNSKYVRGIQKACKTYNIHSSPNLYIDGYDMSLLIDNNGEIIGNQKMVHIAQAKNFYAQSYYKAGEDGFNVFNTKFGKIGIVVCFDRHYPESIRTLALKGADLIIIPTANTYDEDSEIFKWEIKIQAFQNSVNIVMCNRVGLEDEMMFNGESIVADYNGHTVAVGDDSENLIYADLDLENTLNVRNSKNYTNLRRKEFYE